MSKRAKQRKFRKKTSWLDSPWPGMTDFPTPTYPPFRSNGCLTYRLDGFPQLNSSPESESSLSKPADSMEQ